MSNTPINFILSKKEFKDMAKSGSELLAKGGAPIIIRWHDGDGFIYMFENGGMISVTLLPKQKAFEFIMGAIGCMCDVDMKRFAEEYLAVEAYPYPDDEGAKDFRNIIRRLAAMTRSNQEEAAGQVLSTYATLKGSES